MSDLLREARKRERRLRLRHWLGFVAGFIGFIAFLFFYIGALGLDNYVQGIN